MSQQPPFPPPGSQPEPSYGPPQGPSSGGPPADPGGPGRPGGGSRRTLLIGAVVVVVVLALVGGGVLALRGKDDDKPSASDDPTTSAPAQSPSASSSTSSTPDAGIPPQLAKYYAQKLDWHSCSGDKECATLTVPLDYANPGARAIQLAVIKAPAQGKRLGSMVVNPGGPGGPTVQYVASGWMQAGTLGDHYDVVGFDPRGVGNSTPLKCLDTKQLDSVLSTDPDPDTAAERKQLDAQVKAMGDACLANSGDLARHISTAEVAKDMDVLRQALGERKLTYFGASYGTFLGATYANLFPKNVGRMVLDGALDPALSNEQLTLQQAHGFEVALRAYVADCVGQGDCVLGGSVAAGLKRLQAFLAQVDAHPLATGTDRPLTQGLATLGIWSPLYSKASWPELTSALEKAFKGDGSGLLALSDQYTDRGPNGYEDNAAEILYAVNCLDHDDYIPTSQVPSHLAQFEKASPTFGKSFAYSLSTCSTWPVKSGQHTVAMHAKGAPPIVVIGTTRDPATPLAWAKALARELDSGVLITRDGDGHTGYEEGNSCVDGAVDNYLVDDKVPRDGLAC